MTRSAETQDDLGELERVGDGARVRFTRRLPHPRETVWRALTDTEHVNAWFPTTIEGEWRAGEPLRFRFRDGEGPDMHGEIAVYEPPARLQYRWGDEDLDFALADDHGATVLTFTVTFHEIGKVARDSAGWHQCLGLLDYAVDDQPVPADAQQAWKRLFTTYTERFGEDTATIGPPEGFDDH